MDAHRPAVDAAPLPGGLSGTPAGLFHIRAWVLWLVAAFTPAVLTKNPWYLAITVAAMGLAHHRLARGAVEGWAPMLRLGLLLTAAAALLTPLLVKAGETTLLTLPAFTLRLPLATEPPPVLEIGGRVSLESVVYGLSTGLALMTILLTFATFSAAADPYRMLRSIPRFLHRSGVVLSIAVTFVPQMMAAQREIREAQALRGHRFRGLRDLTPLFVTLLAEALERSLTLAEALEARGFGGAAEGGGKLASRGPLAGALGLLLAGAFLRGWAPGRPWGDALLALGTAALAAALWAVGRQVRRSRFRHQRWRRRDTAVALASGVSLAVLATCWAAGGGDLAFYPYPRLRTPALDPWVALALVLLATPALAAGPGAEQGPAGAAGGGGP